MYIIVIIIIITTIIILIFPPRRSIHANLSVTLARIIIVLHCHPMHAQSSNLSILLSFDPENNYDAKIIIMYMYYDNLYIYCTLYTMFYGYRTNCEPRSPIMTKYIWIKFYFYAKPSLLFFRYCDVSIPYYICFECNINTYLP